MAYYDEEYRRKFLLGFGDSEGQSDSLSFVDPFDTSHRQNFLLEMGGRPTYDEPAPMPEPETRSLIDRGKEFASDWMRGSVSLAESAAWLDKRSPLPSVIGMAGAAADALLPEDFEFDTGRAMEYWGEQLSPEAKEARSQTYLEEGPEGDIVGIGDFGLEKVLSDVFTNIPSFMASVGGGGVAAKGMVGAINRIGGKRWATKDGMKTLMEAAATSPRAARAAKLVERVGMALGYGITEGLMSAGMAGAEVEERVESAKHEDLMLFSARYRDIYNSAEDETDQAARVEYAKGVLSDEVGFDVAMKVGLFTAGTGAPAGFFLGPLGSKAAKAAMTKEALESITQSTTANVVKGVATEGIQEFVQSGGEQLYQNLGIRAYVDSRQGEWDGVAEAAVAGGITGGIMGGGYGALQHRVDTKSRDQRLAAKEMRDHAEEVGLVFQQLRDAQAPQSEVKKLLRWQLVDNASVPELVGAARELAETGVLPQKVTDRMEGHFNETGTLTEVALQEDYGKAKDQVFAEIEGATPELLDRLFYEHGVSGYQIEDRLLVPVPDDFKDKPGLEILTKSLDKAEVSYRLRKQGESITTDASGRINIAPEATAEEAQIAVEMAGYSAATSPNNSFAEPTPGQIKAGNYRKGRVRLAGLNITIENPAGSIRKSKPGAAKKWSRKLKKAYGYITGVQDGADGDKLDVFVGPEAHNPEAKVYVVNQVNPETGAFDEHKVMLGFKSPGEAKDAYKAEYTRDWRGLQSVTEMTNEQFRDWVNNGDLTVSADGQFDESGKPRYSISKEDTGLYDEQQLAQDETLDELDFVAVSETGLAPVSEPESDRGGQPARDLPAAAADGEMRGQQGRAVLSDEDSRPGADRIAAARKEWREKGSAAPAFKRWFGRSVITEKTGEPRVVYRGSPRPTKHFVLDPARGGESTGTPAGALGVFFTTNKAQARTYGGNLRPAYMRIENPYYMGVEEFGSFDTVEQAQARRQELLDAGHDGIIVDDEILGDDQAYYISLRGKQDIKSADPNNQTGMFSEDPDSRFSLDEEPDRVGMAQPHVKAIVRRLSKGWTHSATVVQSQEELPENVLADLKAYHEGAKVEGVYDPLSDQMYLVADNLTDEAAIQRVLFEEVLGHKGLRLVFGRTFNQFLDQAFERIGRPRLAQVTTDYSLDLDTVEGRREAVDEYLAKMDPQAEPTLWEMFTAWVRRWWRDAFNTDMPYTDAELKDLMEVVFERVKYGVMPQRSDIPSQVVKNENGEVVRFSLHDGETIKETDIIPEDPTEEDLQRVRVEGAIEAIYAPRYNGKHVMLVESLDKGKDSLIELAFERGFDEMHLPDGGVVNLKTEHKMMITARDRVTTNRRLTKEENAAIEAMGEGRPMSDIEAAKVWFRNQVNRFPVSDGWAKMEFGGWDKDGKPTVKTQPYSYHKDPETGRAKESTMDERVSRIARQLTLEVKGIQRRAAAGDRVAQVMVRQMGWYTNMRSRLREEFGAAGDAVADILGATSPNTAVPQNWDSMIDAIGQLARGEFDFAMKPFLAHLDAGGTVGKYKGPVVTKSNEKLFGMNSKRVMEALANVYRVIQPGSSPKAKNFAMNLIGASDAATIDVWAARLLQRLAGQEFGAKLYPRIPIPAETGVPGNWSADVSRVTGAFGFGQAVLAQSGQDLGMAPHELQALAWFHEKALWVGNDWSAAEGGSFEEQADLAALRRFLAGLSVDRPEGRAVTAEQGSERLTEALRASEGVVTFRAPETVGSYAGEFESAFDMELTAGPDFDPAHWVSEVFRLAKDANQESAFVSRVVPEGQDSPTARPGLEVYFKEGLDQATIDPILEGLRARGIDGFTQAVDPRNRFRGEETYIGIRMQVIPELAAIYDDQVAAMDDEQLRAWMAEKEASLFDMVSLLMERDDVAFASAAKYETIVAGRGTYDEFNQANVEGSDPASGDQAADPWTRPLAEAVARTVEGIRRSEREAGVLQRSAFSVIIEDGDERQTTYTLPKDQGGSLVKDSRDVQPATSVSEAIFVPEKRGSLKPRLLSRHKNVQVGELKTGVEIVRDWTDAAHIVAPIRKSSVETLAVLVTDKANKPLAVLRHSFGTQSGASVHPEIIIQQAMTIPGAAKLWAAHNHPSGKVNQSSTDHNITGVLNAALSGTALNLRGMIVVAPNSKKATLFNPNEGAYAYDHMGDVRAAPRSKGAVGITERRVRKVAPADLEVIDGIDAAVEVVSRIKEPRAVLLLNHQHGVIGVAPVAKKEGMLMRSEKHGVGINRIIHAIGESNSNAVIVKAAGLEEGLNIARAITSTQPGVMVLDVLWKPPGAKSWSSARERRMEDAWQDNRRAFFSLKPETYSTEPFYSQLERTAEQKLPGKGTGASFAQAIDAWVKKGEVKAEEVEWSGVKEWLAEQDGKLTKDRVVEFIQQNQVRVEEVELGAVGDYVVYDGENQYFETRAEAEQYAIEQGIGVSEDTVFFDNRSSTTKFSEYQTPGGENYRELLLTLPGAKPHPGLARFKELNSTLRSLSEGETEELNRLGREIYPNGIPRPQEQVETREHDGYRSGHFDEPNVLAHVRFNERTDAEGKRVLFIEEVQSDWHQEGRKSGYKKGDVYTVTNKDGIRKFVGSEAEANQYITDSGRTDLRLIREPQNNRAVPDAPFKKTWPLLAMKRMIRYAAENGFDRIAWTSGEMQADRYDLSKQIDSVHIFKTKAGKDDEGNSWPDLYDVDVMKDGAAVDLGAGQAQIDISGVEELLGKDLAKKAEEQSAGGHDYTGVDLKVGGEGMKAFYDKMLPAAVNKYVKKWGAKVGLSSVASEPSGRYSVQFRSEGVRVIDRQTPEGEYVGGIFKDLDDANAFRDSLINNRVPSIDVTDAMRESVMQGQPRFSLAGVLGGSAPADPRDAIVDSVIRPTPTKALSVREKWQRLREGIASQTWDDRAWHFKWSMIDQGAPIERLERQQMGRLLDAADSAYKLYGLTKNLPAVMQAVFKRGIPEFRDGVFMPVEGRKGLMEIFRRLLKEPELLRKWEAYAAARRAQRLIGQGREQNLTQDQIDELLTYEQDYPFFAEIFREWNEFNDQALQLAVDRGAMTQEMKDLWATNDYVPFYRVMEDLEEGNERTPGWQTKRGLDGQSVDSRRLTGADARVDKVFENMVLNTAKIMSTIYKNETMRRVVGLANGIAMNRVPMDMKAIRLPNDELIRALVKGGVADRWIPTRVKSQFPDPLTDERGYVREAVAYLEKNMTAEELERYQTFFRAQYPAGPKIVSVYENGKPVFYEVEDPDLLRTIQGMGPSNFGALVNLFLMKPKGILTSMVTSDPGFMAANYFRDLIASWVTAPAKGNFLAHFKDSIMSVKDIWEGDLGDQLMMAGGMQVGYYSDYRDENLVRGIREQVDPGWNMRRLYRSWRKLGAMSEQANRLAIAKNVLANGGSMAEAAWQAQDVLNFTQNGANASAQFLFATVPFMNARIQGLYKMWRAARNDNLDGFRMSFMLKGMGIIAATLALIADNWDREEYDRLPEHTKDTYWNFFTDDGQHFKLPKPFELGTLFATTIERTMRRMGDQETDRQFMDSVFRAVFETFAFNPTPQVAKPIIEQFANRSMFTGREIVNRNLKSLNPEAQYHPWTSETARTVGAFIAGMTPEGLKPVVPDFIVSPVRIEHAVRSYFGTMGFYLMQMSDNVTRSAMDLPAAPAPDVDAGWISPIVEGVARRFYGGDADNPRGNRYASELYEVLDKANDLYRTYNAYIRQGRYEAAIDIRSEYGNHLLFRKRLNDISTQLRDVNTVDRMVRYSQTMSPEEKKERLDVLRERRNLILTQVQPLLQWLH